MEILYKNVKLEMLLPYIYTLYISYEILRITLIYRDIDWAIVFKPDCSL